MKSQCLHSWSWSHPRGPHRSIHMKTYQLLLDRNHDPPARSSPPLGKYSRSFSFPLWFGFVSPPPPPRSCPRLSQPAQVSTQNHSEYSRRIWPAKSRAGFSSHIISNNEIYAGICLFDLSLITWLAPSELPAWIPRYFHAKCFFLIYLTSSALVFLYIWSFKTSFY